ncbi:MAG TPA: site-2 protease family protein, partial [Fodinibius sp.]|nr:site-2 protease family protein [Fodinibius sp.]
MDKKPPFNSTNHPFEEVTAESDRRADKKFSPDLSGKILTKHIGLFVATFVMVALAGASFVGFKPVLFPVALPDANDFYRGALFAGLLLGFLGVHEFGHYFTAIRHKIKVTLPYFIPIPLGIGTLGAVIRIKQRINDNYKMFDVGIAGPLAGFIVSLAVLLYGFTTLPDASYIQQFEGHEAVKTYV